MSTIVKHAKTMIIKIQYLQNSNLKLITNQLVFLSFRRPPLLQYIYITIDIISSNYIAGFPIICPKCYKLFRVQDNGYLKNV